MGGWMGCNGNGKFGQANLGSSRGLGCGLGLGAGYVGRTLRGLFPSALDGDVFWGGSRREAALGG